ncbi:hypothetical protein ADP71_15320 [Vitreoscilla sp. C1]|uniref:hypothetical protein n=1 Tax=Vitreoscilla sp. (strain C1) TaxID=96942 RepID=UPI000CDCB4EE|nr:hypothetical protein [Vitreoscilla sp. C1]AUZ05114.1 hypothetical protein ADP71_15320 [Vitreoscilla sp. C1]
MKTILLSALVLVVSVLSACASSGQLAQYSACRSDGAAALVGRSNLNDAQIKEITGANMVRRMLPNQPVTKDQRLDRVNVIIDVPTKQIIRASCG